MDNALEINTSRIFKIEKRHATTIETVTKSGRVEIQSCPKRTNEIRERKKIEKMNKETISELKKTNDELNKIIEDSKKAPEYCLFACR